MFSKFNKNINSKVDTNLYLFLIVLLSLIICYLQPKMIIPLICIVGLTYYFSRRNIINKEIFFQ